MPFVSVPDILKMQMEYDRSESPSALRDLCRRLGHRWKEHRLIIDICLKPAELPGRAKYTRRERWTDKTAAELHAEGYRKAIGFKDSLAWWGVPVYARITNGHEIDTASVPISQDTAFTLNDNMMSSATSDFIKGMARGAMQSMDIQKMIMIAVVGIGAIFGLKMLGVF